MEEKEKFIEVCRNGALKKVDDVEHRLDQLDNSIDQEMELLDGYIEKKKEVRKRLKKVKTLFGSGKNSIYAKEYDRLMSLDKVLSLEISGDRLYVYTDILYAVDPRTELTHRIGNFRISIPMNGRGSVLWKNLDPKNREKGRRPGPHIHSDGKACHGNTKETFRELIENYEFAAATVLAISFIEEVNVSDSWGKSITDWPVVIFKKSLKKRIQKPEKGFWKRFLRGIFRFF